MELESVITSCSDQAGIVSDYAVAVHKIEPCTVFNADPHGVLDSLVDLVPTHVGDDRRLEPLHHTGPLGAALGEPQLEACRVGAVRQALLGVDAMGVSGEWARGALRLTLGRTTTAADTARAADVIVSAVNAAAATPNSARKPASRR